MNPTKKRVERKRVKNMLYTSTVPNDMMDVFLYSLSRRKKEMRNRIKHGKKLYKGMVQSKG
jgi:hypothetical protein